MNLHLDPSLAPDVMHVLGEELNVGDASKDNKGASGSLGSIDGSLLWKDVRDLSPP